MPNGIQLSSGVVVGQPKPLDAKYGPYNSTAEALSDITPALRYRGLTVGVLESGVFQEYWFLNGTSNTDFVLKASGTNTASATEYRYHQSTTTGTYTLAQGRNVELELTTYQNTGDTLTVTLPRQTIGTNTYDGAQHGDRLCLHINYMAAGTLVLQQYVFDGSSYLSTLSPVFTRTNTPGVQFSNLRYYFVLRNKVWELEPVQEHQHVIADITNLQSSLDGKQAAGSYAPLDANNKVPIIHIPTHNHVITEVVGLTDALAGKASVSHTHLSANVTDLISNAGPSFIYRYGGVGAGQNFENSSFVGPSNVGLVNSPANGSLVGAYGFYGGWDDLEYTRLWVTPSQLFPHCNRFRIIALTKCSSIWNDGIWTMVRSLSPSNLQTTIPGLQAFGGAGVNQPNASRGVFVGISDNLELSSYTTPITFIAYFAAYNGGNGGVIGQSQIVLQGFNV